MKVLLVTFYYPPAGGAGVQRPLKFATHLPELGIETHVLAPDEPSSAHPGGELAPPSLAWVHRVPCLGPRGRAPAEEPSGQLGLELYRRRALLFGRKLLLPDENVSYNLTAIPAAIRIVREEGIDVVMTTSPPSSIHFVGAAVKRATGARWLADLRDSIAESPEGGSASLGAKLREQGLGAVASLVARSADAVVTVSEPIAEEMRARGARGRVVAIANGSDFEEFAGLDYRRGERFRITHVGSFVGRRDPRPFLTALARVDGVTARFVGDFRAADREWSAGIADRVELIPYAPHRSALELQRDSEALLLLIPEAGGRGRGVLSGTLFEYLAAERPILALVPPDGAAAALLRETGTGVVVAPDDIEGIERELASLRDRWREGTLEAPVLTAGSRAKLSRRGRLEQLVELLHTLERSA